MKCIFRHIYHVFFLFLFSLVKIYCYSDFFTFHFLLLLCFNIVGSRAIPKTSNVSFHLAVSASILALSLPFDFPHSDSVTLMASFHLTSRLNFLNPTQSTLVCVSLVTVISVDCAAYAFTHVSMLPLLSEPAVHGDHVLLQWPFVCGGGATASVGLRPHRHTTACNHYQPRWAKTHSRKVSNSTHWLTVCSVNRYLWSCSDDGVSDGVAVVAGIR